MRLSVTLRDNSTRAPLPGYESVEVAQVPRGGDYFQGLASKAKRRRFDALGVVRLYYEEPTHDRWIVCRVEWTLDPKRLFLAQNVECPGSQHADVYLVPDLPMPKGGAT